MDVAFALQLRVSVSTTEVPAEPTQGLGHSLGVTRRTGGSCLRVVALHCGVGLWDHRGRRDSELWVVGVGVWSVWVYCARWVSLDLGWVFYGGFFWAVGVCQALCCFWCHALVSHSTLELFNSRNSKPSYLVYIYIYIYILGV